MEKKIPSLDIQKNYSNFFYFTFLHLLYYVLSPSDKLGKQTVKA